MIDLWGLGIALLLCSLTFLATRYGRLAEEYVRRRLSHGSPAQKDPLTVNDELIPAIAGEEVVATKRAYDEVHVLLLSWQGGDVRIYNGLVELAKVFRDYYNYDEGDSTIEEYAIPSENSKNCLDEKLSEFLKHEGPRSLLIIYYGGHGAVNEVSRAIWKKFEKDGPEVPWHDLQTKLFERTSDVLLLIDCCAAASATAVTGTKGLVEVEFAGGFEAPTPIWGPHSFTKNLVDELKKFHDSGVTLYELHHSLWNTLQRYRPPQGGRERRAKPHHEWLAPRPTIQYRSIHLQSLLSTAPIQLQNAARTQITSLQRARSFDIIKLQAKVQEIHKWLEPIDQSRFHNSAVAAQENGTGAWILKHYRFKEWKMGTRPFLVIYGTAGCGKTVLCASIMNHIEALCRTRDVSNHRDLTAKFYFSFENFSLQHNLESLLKSIIQQLSFAPEIFSGLRDLYEENTKSWPPSSPSTASLQELLIAGLKARCSNKSNPRNVFLFVDALDEIPVGSPRTDVINFLKELAASNIPFLHILITSRPKSDITSRLSTKVDSWTELHVDKTEIRADIGVYVDKVLKTHFVPPLPEDTEENVRKRLTRDQDGMFRWAKLQMESLKRLDPQSPEMVEAALLVLPPTLNASYLKILEDIPAMHQQQAQNALTWLCLATRPLFIEEIVEACATYPGANPGFQESRRLRRHEYLDQILKDLITIDPPLAGLPPSPRRNVVRLGHFSVREYLTGTDIANSGAAIFKVTPDADKFIAQSCLVYLFYNNSIEKSEQAYCLRDYAWNQWAWHSLDIHPSTRSQAVIELFESCVYERSLNGFDRLRSLGLIDWVDPDSEEDNFAFHRSLRNPYFYEEFRLHLDDAEDTFRYQPLPQGCIRLLRILPSEYNSPELRCHILHKPLARNPQYDAISYTWSYGNERPSYIRLDGQVFAVRGKSPNILRTLRSTNYSTTLTIWLDAISIDMQNMDEKNVQVGLMAEIYRQAKEVAIVLEDEEVVPDAITIIEELSTLLNDDDAILNPNLDGLRRIVGKYGSATTMRMILRLFSQSWWGRMWPIQEVVLASKATIVYGKTRINFDKIQTIMNKDKIASQLLQEVFRDQDSSTIVPFLQGPWIWTRARALGELRMTFQSDGKIELPQLLYASRLNNVTYPPDRIFSIYPLSLIGMEPKSTPHPMVVDYSRSYEDIFLSCSVYLLELYQNLDLFSYVTPYYESKYYFLPSWASTFKPVTASNYVGGDPTLYRNEPYLHVTPFVKGKFQPLEKDVYSACGTLTTAALSFQCLDSVRNRPCLTIEGGVVVDQILDCVRLTSGYAEYNEEISFDTQQEESLRYEAIQRAIEFYKRCLTVSTEVFWRTLVADQWDLGTRKSAKLHEFLTCELGKLCGDHTPPGVEPPARLAFAYGRTMFSSIKGYLGLGPAKAQSGDYIVVLPGGKAPYVLRRVPAEPVLRGISDDSCPARNELPLMQLIGECYVDGIMDGEIMQAAKAGKYEFQDVRIV